MTVSLTQISLEDVRLELLLLPPVSLSECIAAAGKTGIWTKLSDFAGFKNETLSVSPTGYNFASNGGSFTVTVNSNTSWTVSDNASWLFTNKTSGSGNSTVIVSATVNTLTGSRSGAVTISTSGITKTVSIFQEGFGDPCLT